MSYRSDNLVYNFCAYGFGDQLDIIDTVNFVDDVALLNWYWGVFNNWVVQAMFSYDFVARRSDGFFVVVCNWGNSCVAKSTISIPCFSVSFTFGNNMSVSWNSSGAVLAGYFLAKLFVFDRLSNDFLSFTYGLSSWCANLRYNFFMLDFAVWCNYCWCNYGWGNNWGWSNN
jgi:hypothetical protein